MRSAAQATLSRATSPWCAGYLVPRGGECGKHVRLATRNVRAVQPSLTSMLSIDLDTGAGEAGEALIGSANGVHEPANQTSGGPTDCQQSSGMPVPEPPSAVAGTTRWHAIR